MAGSSVMADTVVQLLILLLFVVIWGTPLLSFVRHPYRGRFDIGLLFSALGIAIVLNWVKHSWGVALPHSDQVVIALLLAEPYLLLRTSRHFRHLHLMQHLLGLGSLVFSWVAVVVLPLVRPARPELIVIAFLALGYVQCYATVAFARSALAAPGILRRRLQLIAIGSSLTAMEILVLAASNSRADLGLALKSLGSLLTLAAMSAWYFGFAPPAMVASILASHRVHGFSEELGRAWP